jgi:hypothetical protein
MKHITDFQGFILNESSSSRIDLAISKIPEDAIKKIHNAIIIKNPDKAPTILSKIKKISPLLYDRIKNASPEHKASIDLSSDLGDLGF